MHESRQLGFQLHVHVQRAVEQARAAASAAILPDSFDGGFFHLGVRDQVQIIVGAEHQHLTVTHADLAGPAAFALAEDFEIHVQSGGLQVARTRKIPALVE